MDPRLKKIWNPDSRVLICPREPDTQLGVFEGQGIGTINKGRLSW